MVHHQPVQGLASHRLGKKNQLRCSVALKYYLLWLVVPDTGNRNAAGVDVMTPGAAEGIAAQWKTAREVPNVVACAVHAHRSELLGWPVLYPVPEVRSSRPNCSFV